MQFISGNFAPKLAICGGFALLCSCAASALPAPAMTGQGSAEVIHGDAGGAAALSGPSLDQPTKILDPEAAQRLMGAKGITLQWIDWNRRGSVHVRREGDVVRITGVQTDPAGPGSLFIDGQAVEIGADYFTFRGIIRISDTPDQGRDCSAEKLWHFAITQNRPYWRLREFEWCDYLTDYVDINF